jgi:hypothetical protein
MHEGHELVERRRAVEMVEIQRLWREGNVIGQQIPIDGSHTGNTLRSLQPLLALPQRLVLALQIDLMDPRFV